MATSNAEMGVVGGVSRVVLDRISIEGQRVHAAVRAAYMADIRAMAVELAAEVRRGFYRAWQGDDGDVFTGTDPAHPETRPPFHRLTDLCEATWWCKETGAYLTLAVSPAMEAAASRTSADEPDEAPVPWEAFDGVACYADLVLPASEAMARDILAIVADLPDISKALEVASTH